MITERQMEFCKRICALAAEHGLSGLRGEFTCSSFIRGKLVGDESDGKVRFQWDNGRHDVDARKIFVTAEQQIHIRLDGPDL